METNPKKQRQHFYRDYASGQYGSIKAIALVDMGRFDEVEAALAQEVADDAHPFGQAMQQLARTVYLDRLEALEAATNTGRDALRRAGELSRTWMQGWLAGTLASLAARMGKPEVAVTADGGHFLAERIADPDLRRAFETQPLARTLEEAAGS